MSGVLVTGGSGFVGANLVRALVAKGEDVRVLDDFSTGRRDYLEGVPGVKVIDGGINDPPVLKRAVKGVRAIVHLAARSGIGPSIERPGDDFRDNVAGTFAVAEAARAAGVERIVLASSGAVLAGRKPPLREDTAPWPLSPYGASKLYGEGLLQAYESAYGILGIALRFSNVYGPFCAHKKSVVPVFLQRCRRGEPLVIYGTGRQTRDFVFVGDVAAAIGRALDVPKGGVYQLGTGVGTSVAELAKVVRKVTGSTVSVERRPPRPGEAARNYADISLASRALRWSPKVSLEEGLRLTADWMAEQGSGARRSIVRRDAL